MLITVRSKHHPNQEMKATLTTLTLTLTTLTLISTAGFTSAAAPTREELRPTGRLDISSRLVRTGKLPTLDWEINYPLGLTEVVDINPDDSLDTAKETRMKIRLAGASYQPQGSDAVVLLQTRISSQGSSWQTLFKGTDSQIDADAYVYNGVVPSGTTIDFSARGKKNSRYWTPSRNTLSENQNIIVLRNGDSVPQYTPAFKQGSIESHVSSYVQNGKIVLGPRDLIYLVEVGQTNTQSGGFDMQDLVYIVTFEEVDAE
jgi:hypothetical protein